MEVAPEARRAHARLCALRWKQWKWYGHDRNDKAVRAGEQPALYEDRFSIMLDDGKVPLFAQQGCWLTCHNGMRDTRNQVVGEPVKKHPLFADAKYDADIRKYLASTRTDDAASWDKTKSKEEIDKIKAGGGFLDLMQWRVNRSGPVGMADDGYVLDTATSMRVKIHFPGISIARR